MNTKKVFSLKIILLFVFVGLLFSSFLPESYTFSKKDKFPYRNAGLTERQAAEHLLSRFTFGVSQTDIDEAVAIGLENWFKKQLDGKQPELELEERLKGYEDLKLSNSEILRLYPRTPILRKMAIEEKVITEEELKNDDKALARKKIDNYRESKGFKKEYEIIRLFTNQKILRAVYSKNQLHEILTDFWFNHFNVSITKNQSTQLVPNYERDAIRPYITAKFGDMLLATAKSPAMLTYLDNFTSMGENEELNVIFEKANKKRMNDNPKRKAKGLNENYAREVMELHTLGVDGGYTQNDVTEAAKVLTGWTIYPFGNYGNGKLTKLLERMTPERMDKLGFVRDGDFLFANNLHQSGSKIVLGKTYNSGGFEEGKNFLNHLANHPSTAKFICKKIATRFINDHPTDEVVAQMSKVFLKSNGDISQVLWAMVSHHDFWQKEALAGKTKSPFEFAISSLRALDADVKAPMAVNFWITKMGQKLYAYQAPTGYPDKAQYWINTGNLLNRMNFGLALASKSIMGVKIDLAALNQNHEPESAEDALNKYGSILIPERDLTQTYRRLEPLVKNEKFAEKVNEAAEKNKLETPQVEGEEMMMEMKPRKANKREGNNFGDHSMLAQVVGIIIGSPEFQKK